MPLTTTFPTQSLRLGVDLSNDTGEGRSTSCRSSAGSKTLADGTSQNTAAVRLTKHLPQRPFGHAFVFHSTGARLKRTLGCSAFSASFGAATDVLPVGRSTIDHPRGHCTPAVDALTGWQTAVAGIRGHRREPRVPVRVRQPDLPRNARIGTIRVQDAAVAQLVERRIRNA